MKSQLSFRATLREIPAAGRFSHFEVYCPCCGEIRTFLILSEAWQWTDWHACFPDLTKRLP
jgi:hypothetical protein